MERAEPGHVAEEKEGLLPTRVTPCPLCPLPLIPFLFLFAAVVRFLEEGPGQETVHLFKDFLCVSIKTRMKEFDFLF